MVNSKKLAEWLSRLVQIPSVNPLQAGGRAGTPGEAEMSSQAAGWFQEFGAEVHMQEVYPNRNNVYGIWRGRADRWAAIDVHMDTVGVEQMIGDPFSGAVADGRVYGRGAVDTKASLAVALALLEAMHQTGISPECNLLLAATVDEENAAQCAPVFGKWVQNQGIPLDELLVAEPTMCHPVFGHKGSIRLKFRVEGASSHSAKPQLGKNAVVAASHLIVALEAEDRRLQAITSNLGPPTLTVSLVSGGVGANIVPDSCEFVIDRRSLFTEKIDDVATELLKLAQRGCPLPVTMEKLGGIDAFLQKSDSPWIRQLVEWSGREPMTVPYGTNAWAYGDLPGECIVLGPGSIDQAHGDVEWVEISELEKLAQIYRNWWGLQST